MDAIDKFLERAESYFKAGERYPEDRRVSMPQHMQIKLIQLVKQATKIIKSTQSCTACSCRPYSEAYLFLEKWDAEFKE